MFSEEKYEYYLFIRTQRAADPAYFCCLSIAEVTDPTTDVIVVSDARRSGDLEFFQHHFSPNRLITCRIHASMDTRVSRAFQFDTLVDAAVSECGLDHVTDWDFRIDISSSGLSGGGDSLAVLDEKLAMIVNCSYDR